MDAPVRPGRSEDVPRAVEYLIQLVLRAVLGTFAFGFGVGALAGYFSGWSPIIVAGFAVLFLLTAIAAWAVKTSRARIVVDGVGPSVFVPPRDKCE